MHNLPIYEYYLFSKLNHVQKRLALTLHMNVTTFCLPTLAQQDICRPVSVVQL